MEGIPLDVAWADVMRRAGYTEAKLRRMAGSSHATLMKFIAESALFKDMLEVDRFTVALAIGRLEIVV